MKKKILVVEDDKILLDAIKDFLSGNGYDLLIAENGESGIKTAKEQLPDIILLDLMLPKKSGYHVLLELKKDKKTKSIPIIIMTAIDTATSRQECLSLGAIDYLIKSEYSLDQIAEKVKKFL